MASESQEGSININKSENQSRFSVDNLTLSQQEFIEGWAFVLGKIALILFVIGFPMVFAVYLSFTDSNLVNLPGEFIGLENYAWVLGQDVWWTSLKNVFLLAGIVIPTNIIFSFSTALLLREKLRGSTLYRVAFLIPVSGPPIIWAIVWKLVLFPNEGGIVNAVLLEFGMVNSYIPFLSDPAYALPSIIVSQMWGFGLSMLIYMAALAGLPASVMESAAMDGANKYQKVRHIIWPLMKPTTFFLVVIQLVLVLRMGFGAVFVMTQGGPLNATMVPSYFIYNLAFQYNSFGQSAAAAILMFIVTALIALLTYKPLQGNAEYYQ
ncbi:carbohydrate ABC transporter permease [Halococcus sp. IIIV-5B]|uniref:carbohydrate ABC transporter permease n=1 Tax=Halococcus sp. IIIV-5B TaxID=2321230 RepID=UPI000E742E40|nr:sugar ABC transporter permease [Halococcus sp. IIIV-5B]RJT07898.1 sugar ABC transporter permease [Halococcus sp. IIIV-5B]